MTDEKCFSEKVYINRREFSITKPPNGEHVIDSQEEKSKKIQIDRFVPEAEHNMHRTCWVS